jgi:hypothetical protein
MERTVSGSVINAKGLPAIVAVVIVSLLEVALAACFQME